MNARDDIHGLSRANMDLFERSAARTFLGSQSLGGKEIMNIPPSRVEYHYWRALYGCSLTQWPRLMW
jgi:hypothetical protein